MSVVRLYSVYEISGLSQNNMSPIYTNRLQKVDEIIKIEQMILIYRLKRFPLAKNSPSLKTSLPRTHVC